MTNPNYRHIIMIADRSGSMSSCREPTEEGINGLFASQASELAGGTGTASLYEFDTEHDTVFEHVPLAEAPTYALEPRFGTALLDAVGFAFTREGAWLATLAEDERPGTVVAVIATDGHENSSREYTAEQIREMITTQREVYGWQVLFLAANLDAVKTGASYGIPASASMNYATTASGTASSYAAVSRVVTASASGLGGAFTDAERAAATDAA